MQTHMHTHTHAHTQPPTSSLKNHRSQNQKGTQKTWKDWQDARHCISSPTVEMIWPQILPETIRKWVRDFHPAFLVYAVKDCQTYMKKVMTDEDWKLRPSQLLVSSPLRKRPPSPFLDGCKPNFRPNSCQVPCTQINTHSVASFCQLACRCNHFAQQALL